MERAYHLHEDGRRPASHNAKPGSGAQRRRPDAFCERRGPGRRRRALRPAPPRSSRSYHASGGGLQGCPAVATSSVHLPRRARLPWRHTAVGLITGVPSTWGPGDFHRRLRRAPPSRRRNRRAATARPGADSRTAPCGASGRAAGGPGCRCSNGSSRAAASVATDGPTTKCPAAEAGGMSAAAAARTRQSFGGSP